MFNKMIHIIFYEYFLFVCLLGGIYLMFTEGVGGGGMLVRE